MKTLSRRPFFGKTTRASDCLRPKGARAFTLTELLVALVILVLLAALSWVFINQSLEMARRGVCMSNLHQIGTATYGYAGDNHGLLPISDGSANYPFAGGMEPQTFGMDPSQKGIAYLIPYIGGSGLTDAEANKDCARVFFCPSSRMTFQANWYYQTSRGCSYVQYCGWWFSGQDRDPLFVNSPKSTRDPAKRLLYCDIACDGTLWFNNHRDANGQFTGTNCLFLDGHVEWVDRSKLTVKAGPVVVGNYYFPDTN